MIQSYFKGLNILHALFESEFVFFDDKVLDYLISKSSIFVDEEAPIVIKFITKDTGRIKPFLKKLGFEHLNSTVTKEFAENRSTKFIKVPPYYIQVTVVKDFELENKLLETVIEKEDVIIPIGHQRIKEALARL